MASPSLLAPLRRRSFRRLAASYTVNELGDWMGIVALSVLVFDRTGSALATTLLFLGTGFLPALIAPLLVARVEQPPPRFVLPVLYCGEAAAFAGLALLASRFSLAAVVAIAAFDGALALASRSLTRAVVATLLAPSAQLRSGNALLNVAFTGGAAIGPGLAGLVVAALGVESALLLDAVSFYLVAWILFTAGPLPQAEPEPGRMRERVRAGIAYIRERVLLRRLLAIQGLAFIFFAAVIPIEVVYAKQTLGAGDSGYGLMLASWGSGMVLGSLLFALLRRRSLAGLLFFSTLAIGAGYLGLALAPSLALACLASLLGGAGNGVQWVAAVSAVQELTAEGMQARVMSVLESIGTAMPGVGFVLGGLVAALSNPRATFFLAGAGVLGIALIGAPLLGKNWAKDTARSGSRLLDVDNDVVLELLPGGAPVRSLPSGLPVQPESEVQS
ncbi:MAG TPA: MFS transporter [Solirubrobacterales bacterium]|jgi:MFS family permease|nr:MFS transporter [Solirubrobacterales bacterium]